MDTTSVKGLRIARLDRVLDAIEGRSAVKPRPERRPRRNSGPSYMPPLTQRFLSTV